MIKKIILPLILDCYNNNTTFNLLAYYKNVLKFSGEIILNIEKRMDDINVSFIPITDVCFFDIFSRVCIVKFAWPVNITKIALLPN